MTKKQIVLDELLKGIPVSLWELHLLARTLYVSGILCDLRKDYKIREFPVMNPKTKARYKMVYINPNAAKKKS